MRHLYLHGVVALWARRRGLCLSQYAHENAVIVLGACCHFNEASSPPGCEVDGSCCFFVVCVTSLSGVQARVAFDIQSNSSSKRIFTTCQHLVTHSTFAKLWPRIYTGLAIWGRVESVTTSEWVTYEWFQIILNAVRSKKSSDYEWLHPPPKFTALKKMYS